MKKPMHAIWLATFFLVSCDGTYSGEGCFPAGSLVATPAGQRPIQDMKIGEVVYAFDESSNEIRTSVVDQLIVHQSTELTRLRISDGADVLATPDHPLWDSGERRWIPAGEVKAGATLLRLGGEGVLEARTVQGSGQERTVEQAVYNLKVRQYENAFVSGVLAHFY